MIYLHHLTGMGQFFEAGKMPARTCVGVAHLPYGAEVEIECIAEVAST